jgi:ElaB/YqjD/DUF883 family membrane-anchored ribosome-binding protein
MAQPGSSDYRSFEGRRPEDHQADSTLDQLNEAASAVTEQAGSIASDIGTAIKERPYTAVAVAAGLAFAAGALWKLSHRRQQSRWDTWKAQMPDTSSLPNWMQRR